MSAAFVLSAFADELTGICGCRSMLQQYGINHIEVRFERKT